MPDHKSKESWKKSLQRLEQYESPSSLDDRIRWTLSHLAWKSILESTYSETVAPDSWVEIECRIIKENHKGRLIKMGWVASLVLVVTLIWLFLPSKTKDEYKIITYETKVEHTIDAPDVTNWMYFDDFCDFHQLPCDVYATDHIKEDWDEMVKAILTLHKAMGDYGTEDYLLDELRRIETEYAELVNNLLNEIWS